MKIVSLNTWGGRAGKEGLLNFFDVHQNDVDIFCLQEIWAAPYEHLEGEDAGALAIRHENIMVYGKRDISELLKNHTHYFRPHHLDSYGLMMLVRDGVPVVEEGDVFVHKERGYVPVGDVGLHARNIQYVKTTLDGRSLSVVNFHGLWNGKGKGDSEDRIEQAKNILEFIKTLEGDVVLCGDFNLLPDTKSIQMFEEFGLRNLIKEFGVTSTRTSHYKKDEKFADYVFVSKGVRVEDFRVLPDEVSDHAPLLLEIL